MRKKKVESNTNIKPEISTSSDNNHNNNNLSEKEKEIKQEDPEQLGAELLLSNFDNI